MGRVVGSRIDRVDAQGKHLLIGFDDGLTLHTHLRMNGSWHRYRPGERWRRSPSRAVCVIEVPDAVAVCFDAPMVELIETRALAIHPALAALGPDLLAPTPTSTRAVGRLRRSRATRHAGGGGAAGPAGAGRSGQRLPQRAPVGSVAIPVRAAWQMSTTETLRAPGRDGAPRCCVPTGTRLTA